MSSNACKAYGGMHYKYLLFTFASAILKLIYFGNGKVP